MKTRTAGFSAGAGKFRNGGSTAGVRNAEMAVLLGLRVCVVRGLVLAILSYEQHVFRAALLSIVFSLAVGPNVALLCRTWCDAHAAAASECHHESSSTGATVASDEHCDDVGAATTAALREDVRRGVSPPDGNQAIPVPRCQLAPETADARSAHEHRRSPPLETGPLDTTLRI